jgi:hypothetical protein
MSKTGRFLQLTREAPIEEVMSQSTGRPSAVGAGGRGAEISAVGAGRRGA